MAQKSSDRNLWQSPTGIIAAAAILGTLTYTVWILTGKYNGQAEPFITGGVLSILYLLSAWAGFRIFRQKLFHVRWRWGWLFIALAMLSITIGKVLWVSFEHVLGKEPFPSLANLFYFLYYPLLLAGVLIFPFSTLKKRERLVLYFDLSIVVIACAMLLWYFFLGPTQTTADPGWSGIIALGYPFGDLLILTGVIALFQRDSEKAARVPLFLLAIGMALAALGDLFFAYYATNGLQYSIAPLNVLWAGSALYIFVSAAWQYRDSLKDLPHVALIDRTHHLLQLLLPYIAAAIGPVLLIISINRIGIQDLRLRGLIMGTLILVALVLARQYVVLRENIEISKEMQRLATTDSLTNLYNRHFFNETFQREIGRARRYEKPLSVLLMDVDNFKFFNDTCGHLQGDIVLRIIADTLTSNLRKSDFLARFGGDEFVVVLPETDLQGAESVSAKMKKAVSDHEFVGQHLSISIGVATFRAGITGEQMLEEADADLYRSKASLTPKITA